MIELSVIVCTYNPQLNIFNKVLSALKNQTLNQQYWQLLIVDNNSKPAISELINIQWHSKAAIIVENKIGLSHARMAGFNFYPHTPLIIFVDDDNILDQDYLKICLQFSRKYPEVGCFGGKSIPIFESPPPLWFYKTNINLGCQDFGDTLYISNFKSSNFKLSEYPNKAPIGTGMAITNQSFSGYKNEVKDNPKRLKLGRKGLDLTSGEDNDIVLTLIKNGHEIAYVPELIVSHYIPENRYSFEYLKKMAFKSNQSWINVLDIHNINPWEKIPRWTLVFRKLKTWFSYKAWRNELNCIKWKCACGTFQGLSEIEK